MKYTIEIARTTKDPKILTEILRGKDNWLARNAALNPYCPREILVEILKEGKNDLISWYAACNLNCPEEILAEILKRERNDKVSEYSSNNKNCPPEARINWMMKMGKIGKEDPSKHIIEYENIKEYDFQDLKDLL